MNLHPLARSLAILGCVALLGTSVVAQYDWTQQTPTTSPSARTHTRMSFEPSLGGAIMFGGFNAAFAPLGDTWYYDGLDWLQLSPVASPPARADYALEYDSVRAVTVLFGGTAGLFPGNQTWEFDGATWAQITTTGAPGGRNACDLAYDSNRGIHVLFGGQGFSFIPFGDTWEYNGATATWTQIAGTNPFRRAGHRMVYDAIRDRVVMFGGQDEVIMNGDTWEYNGQTQTWTEIFPVNTPSPRRDYSMVFDVARGVTVLHGGLDANFVEVNDTWEYDGVNWTQITTATSPSPRTLTAAEWNAVTGDVMLFGGSIGGTPTNQTWHYAPAGPSAAYPGNGTDAEIGVLVNGVVDAPATNVHSVAASSALTLQYVSPNGTLNGAPFLAFLQVFSTGTTINPEPVLGVYYSPFLFGAILVNGLANPFAILNPVLGSYQTGGSLPASLAGTNTSFLVNLLPFDLSFSPFNLGVAEAHEFQIQ